MKLACSTVFRFSFVLKTLQALVTTISLHLRVRINRPDYKLSYTALRTKARFVKVKHDLLHIVYQVNQSKT